MVTTGDPLEPEKISELELIGAIKEGSQGKCQIRNPIVADVLRHALKLSKTLGAPNKSHDFQITGPASSLNVFYSYSHKDETLREELEKHLKIMSREGLLKSWHDRCISPGKEWSGEIDEHLETADIILLLISADFIASDYCYDIEMTRAIQRHKDGKARVIPILLRKVDWHGAPFGNLQVLPPDGKPITSWDNLDEAFTAVAQGIRKVIQELLCS